MTTRKAPDGWFAAWLSRHLQRHPRHDWPTPDSPAAATFFGVWKVHFAQHKVTQAEADAASVQLGASADGIFPDRHLSRLLGAIEARRRAQQDPAHDRAAAEAASRDCPHCAGVTGFAYGGGDRRRLGYCTCPLGRWVRDRHDAELRSRMIDWAECPSRLDFVDPRDAMPTESHPAPSPRFAGSHARRLSETLRVPGTSDRTS